MKLKRGKLSVDELDFIRTHLDTMTNKEIGETLKRSPSLVEKYRTQEPENQKTDDMNPFIVELHAKHFWPTIQQMLVTSEIPYFEQEWARFVNQFQTNEILATDEMMIKDLIIAEILANRALKNRRKMMVEASELERQLDIEQDRKEDDRNEALEASLSTQINALISCLPNTTTEHEKYAIRADKKLDQLKATRSARFRQVEESRKNFFELVKELDTRSSRMRDGRWMELMRQGGEKVAEHWGEFHEYADNTVDRPLLTPESVMKGKEDVPVETEDNQEGDKASV